MKKMLLTFSLLFIFGMNVFADGNYKIIEQLIRQCEQNLDVNIRINATGERSVRRQAELMAAMNSTQLNMYDNGNPWYIKEMKDCTLSGSARTNEFERLIRDARSRGSFVSRHLTGDAVDITPSTQQVRNWLESNGVSVKDEREEGIACWHLQLK
jgi:TorA maturation chaperone TorD